MGLAIHYTIDSGWSEVTLECLDRGGSRLGGLANAIAELVEQLFAVAGDGIAGLAFVARPQADAGAGETRPVKQLSWVDFAAGRDVGMAEDLARRNWMSRQYVAGEFI